MKTIVMYGVYESPKVEVIVVAVEKGFATSVIDNDPPAVEPGGNPF